MANPIGIDLGTSNSCVSTVVDGGPVVLVDEQGNRTQPSVVAFGYGQTVVVGHRARQQLVYAPENTVHSVKRLIGRRFNAPEVERLRANVAWGIAEGPNGDARVRVQGKVHSAQEVSAHILRHLKKLAEDALREPVTQAVITVPAYFNDQQRQATRDAATIAGLECLRILNEPTAAALAYGYGRGQRQYVTVYDLGGGTFDVSVLRIEDDVFEVISTAGDTFLGGDDFDMALVTHLFEVLRRTTGLSLSDDPGARARLRDAAEKAKISLTTSDFIEVRIANVVRPIGGKPVHLNTRLDRALLSRLTAPLVQRTFEVCSDALAQAGLSTRQIDRVILVGGMTRSPLIQSAVASYFGQEPAGNINPDEVVAIGAALQAHALTTFDEISPSVLLDVTPQTLGVRTVGGFVEPVIPRNTSIPTEASRVFHTAHDNQTEVRIQVYQGESRQSSDNDLLAEFVLTGLRSAVRGTVRVKVGFAIDADGIVHVSAEDMETGRVQEVLIEASSGISEEELKEMRFDDLTF